MSAAPPDDAGVATPHHQRGRWIGRRLIQTDGDRIGTIVDVYRDDPAATWALVRRRRVGSRYRVVPLERARSSADGITVPYTREDVASGPSIERGAPTPQEAARLIAHYEGVESVDGTQADGSAAAAPPQPATTSDSAIANATAEATYQGERLSLYRAKLYRGAPTSATRLRELERASDAAEARLQHLRARHLDSVPADHDRRIGSDDQRADEPGQGAERPPAPEHDAPEK